MLHRACYLCFLISIFPLYADAPLSVPLWPHGAPGALGSLPKDIPTLTLYSPDPSKATGAAFVICPGGAYAKLSPSEGEAYALWLGEHGIAGIVLRYRLGPDGYHDPSMLQDAARALRLARANATAWKIDPHRIGIMGSSAGGHLASTLLTHFDAGNTGSTDPVERESSRPDLGVLCYAVITMGPDSHKGSRTNLLGPSPTPEQIEELSNEKHVTADTPPCFIWHTYEDPAVKVINAIDFASALLEKGVPFELHVYEKGGHGMGLGKGLLPGAHHRWSDDLLAWLGERGWLSPGANTSGSH